MTPAIRVENLGKKYRIDHAAKRCRYGYRTLRESLIDAAKAPLRRWRNGSADGRAEDFWALRGVEFEIQPGEVVGIIGRNGAGKSTLLKVLARITKPTTGRVELRGRVGSLLEVGTGFHPELTGRENIYLNGSILGMSRKEITRRFDEIVTFAEVERFLDTPVKRYSSGMYVRLAFAVAAHLDSEILTVDEVLAVGDANFQRKCLSKMGEVGRSGRTVLFVSHNLSSIRALCQKAVTIESGRVVGAGPADEQVSSYFERLGAYSRQSLETRTDREGNGCTRITSIRIMDQSGATVEQVLPGDAIRIVIGYQSREAGRIPEIALSCFSAEGHKLFHVDTHIRGQQPTPLEVSGEYTCLIERLPLAPGIYHINAQIKVDAQISDHIYSAAVIETLAGDFYGSGRTTLTFGSLVYLDHDWD